MSSTGTGSAEQNEAILWLVGIEGAGHSTLAYIPCSFPALAWIQKALQQQEELDLVLSSMLPYIIEQTGQYTSSVALQMRNERTACLGQTRSAQKVIC